MNFLFGPALVEHLGIGVDSDEFDIAQSCFNHAIDSVATGATHADHLDICGTNEVFRKIEKVFFLSHIGPSWTMSLKLP